MKYSKIGDSPIVLLNSKISLTLASANLPTLSSAGRATDFSLMSDMVREIDEVKPKIGTVICSHMSPFTLDVKMSQPPITIHKFTTGQMSELHILK